MFYKTHNNPLKTWFVCTLIWASVFLSSSSQAVEIDDLYQAEVAVKDQGRDGRFAVYPEALVQVMVKLTGDRSVSQRPQLRVFIANAVRMVQQFSYRDLPDDMPLLEEEYRHLLVVNFDQAGVRQALVEAGVPIWARTRPETLLWLAVEDRGSRYLLAANQSAEIQGQLEKVASQRGLPIMLPLLDLEDQMQLSYADVWGDFQSDLLRASERYGAEVVLVGRMYRTFDGRWQARWSLYDSTASKEIARRWQIEANDQPAALANGIEGAADRIAQRYAQVYSIGGDDSVMLSVMAVDDLQAYARATAYLESLDMVSAVQATRVFADEVLFKLDIRGDLEGLVQAITLGNTLDRVNHIADESDVQAYVYQLAP